MSRVKRLLVALLIVAAVFCLFTCEAKGNELRVGVVFTVSTGGQPDLSTLRPWLSAHVDRTTPTPINRFRAAEMHHSYVGAALYGVGHLAHIKLLRVIGGVLVIDDAIQHTLRINSPVHMASDRLYRYGWYRSLINLGNNIMPDKQ